MAKAYRHMDVTAHSLAGIGIFSALDFDARLDVARRCAAGRFDRRTPVLSIEDDSRDVFFVVEGRVRVTIYTVGGKEVSFRDIVTGMHFGDLAAIDGEPRSANVVTLENSLLAWMPPDEFWSVLETYPSVAGALLTGFAGLVRQLTERVVEFSTLGASNRLHAELLRMARETEASRAAAPGHRLAGVIPPQGAEVPHPPTHAELASRISSHREAVSREMQRLADAGIVEKGRGKLVFSDLEQLQSMVDEVKGG